jgi:hypothetical protein
MDWRCSLSGREPALQVWSSEFTAQSSTYKKSLISARFTNENTII